MRVTLPIAQGFYESESLPISAQRAVNWVPSVPQTSTITDANLFPTDGIRELISGDITKVCRGAHVFAGVPYFVIDDELLRLERTVVEEVESFSLIPVGSIVGADRVFMADNGRQLCIVAPPDNLTVGKSYIFTDDPDTLTEITDANFDGPASSVVFIDGYFVFSKADGKKFFNSPLNEGLTGYEALDFNVAEADPDDIRALGVIKNQLYVFGSETIQVFRNVGRFPAPFAPIAGAVIDVGVTNPKSIVKFNGGLAFVGQRVNESPSVFYLNGVQAERISTKAIDNELSKTDTSMIFCWTYAEAGAVYLGVATQETCFVIDIVNGRWHERQSIEFQKLTRYRVSHIVTGYGRNLVGDLFSGSIGELNENVYTEYGIIVPRFITSRPFDNLGKSVNVAAIEAVVESGVGLANDITVATGRNAIRELTYATGGYDPQITLSWSDNGARTFTGDIAQSLGKIGEYNKRAIWRRMGTFFRDRVLRFEVKSPTNAVLIKVEADFG